MEFGEVSEQACVNDFSTAPAASQAGTLDEVVVGQMNLGRIVFLTLSFKYKMSSFLCQSTRQIEKEILLLSFALHTIIIIVIVFTIENPF